MKPMTPSVAAALLLFSLSAGSTQTLEADAEAMTTCYELQAIRYSLQTCLPAIEAFEFIFAKCDAEERNVRARMEAKRRAQGNSSSFEITEQSAAMIGHLRDEWRARIELQMEAARAKANKRCDQAPEAMD